MSPSTTPVVHVLKKLPPKEKISVCDNCKITQKSANCSVKLTLRIHIQNSNQAPQKLQLHIYPDAVLKLISVCDLSANETTVDEITEAVLKYALTPKHGNL